MADTTTEVINTIIDNALATASDSTEQANDAADELIARRAGIYIPVPNSEAGFDVEAVEPEIPETGDSTYTYESQRDALIDILSGELANLIDTYFPIVNDAYDEGVAWVLDAINNGGTGINAAVEDQEWQRMREQIIAETARTVSEIQTGYTSKAHSLPQGSMLKQINQARYEGAGRSGVAATAVVAKQLEMEIENVRFAIGKALEMRVVAVNAAVDYIRALLSAPDIAVKIAELDSDVRAKMMAAAASWYGARLDRDKIVLSSKLAEMGSRDDLFKARKNFGLQGDQVEVSALIAAADSYARTASAALASLNSVVSATTNAFA